MTPRPPPRRNPQTETPLKTLASNPGQTRGEQDATGVTTETSSPHHEPMTCFDTNSGSELGRRSRAPSSDPPRSSPTPTARLPGRGPPPATSPHPLRMRRTSRLERIIHPRWNHRRTIPNSWRSWVAWKAAGPQRRLAKNSPGRIRTSVFGSKGRNDWPLHHRASKQRTSPSPP